MPPITMGTSSTFLIFLASLVIGKYKFVIALNAIKSGLKRRTFSTTSLSLQTKLFSKLFTKGISK